MEEVITKEDAPQEQPARRPDPKPWGVGMPAWLHLNEFGRILLAVFGGEPYLVGSALERRDPRDIDVRLVVSDKQFHDLFKLYTLNQPGTGWAYTCMAWSIVGTQMVGKNVDFQIMNETHAVIYKGQPRLPIGFPPARGYAGPYGGPDAAQEG